MSMSEYDFQESDIDEFNVSGNPIEFKILPGKDSYDFYFTFNITPEERVIPKIKEIKPKPKAKIVIKKEDRKSVVQGKSVDLGGRRIIKKKKKITKKKKKNKNVIREQRHNAM